MVGAVVETLLLFFFSNNSLLHTESHIYTERDINQHYVSLQEGGGGTLHALTLIRIEFRLSMSEYSKEVVAMLEGEKEDEIQHIERIILSKPFPYRTVTLSEIRSRVYPHIQYTTTLKDYIPERHASKLWLVGHLHDKAQTRVCLHEDAHRFHTADLASYHIAEYVEMVMMAVAVLAASEGIGWSIKISELVVTWDYRFDRYMRDVDKGEQNLGLELLSMTKTTKKRGYWYPYRGDMLRSIRWRLRESETAQTLVELKDTSDGDVMIRLTE